MSASVAHGAPVPANEDQRLAALRGYDILTGSHEKSLDAICRVVCSVFDSSIALVSLSDRNRQVFKGRVGLDADDLPRDLAPCGYAILGTTPMVVQDASRDDRFLSNPLVVNPPHVRFYAGMPLLTPDRFALGTLCAIDAKVHVPSPGQLANLVDLAQTVMDIFNLRRAMSRARDCALTDLLTGLANRSGLMLELESTIERSRGAQEPFSLLYLGVDNLNHVNDTRGRAAGDDILKMIGTLLAHSTRNEDFTARLGSDEFAIVIPATDARDAHVLAQRVLDRLSKAAAQTPCQIGFSIGLASFPKPPGDADEAIAIANRLMCAAKHGGENRIVALASTQIGVGV